MRFAVFLCVLAVCTLPLTSGRRKLKADTEPRIHKPNFADPCNVKIDRRIEDDGYHRELVTYIRLEQEQFLWCIFNNPATVIKKRAVCNVHIQENLPSSVYIDPYELESRELETGLRGYFHSEVDLELPYELAKPLTVDMFAADKFPTHDREGYAFDFEYEMRVPIHIRYQAPAENVTHQTVEIPPPANIAVRCMKQSLKEGSARSSTMKPPHGLEIRSSQTIPATPAFLETYFAMKAFVQLNGIPEDPIVIQVPVGEVRHKPFVSPVTGIVSLSAVAIILLGIYRARIKMKNDANLRKAMEASQKDAKPKKKETKKEK